MAKKREPVQNDRREEKRYCSLTDRGQDYIYTCERNDYTPDF
jgi:hypothetical protein